MKATEMTLKEMAEAIKYRWREKSSGGCRMLSEGEDCDCTLCLVGNLVSVISYKDYHQRIGGSMKVTDEMIKAALATEYPGGDGPVSQDIGFGMMRKILQNAFNRLKINDQT